MKNDINKLLSSSESLKMEGFWTKELGNEIYSPVVKESEFNMETARISIILKNDFYERIKVICDNDSDLEKLLMLSFWSAYIFKSCGQTKGVIRIDFKLTEEHTLGTKRIFPFVLAIHNEMTISEICQMAFTKYNDIVDNRLFPLEQIEHKKAFFHFDTIEEGYDYSFCSLIFTKNLEPKLELVSNYFDDQQLGVLQSRLECFYLNGIKNMNQSIQDIDIISKKEHKELIELSTGKKVALTLEDIPINKFSGMVSQNPEACAVICHGENFTYGKLDRLSNQLANYLKENFQLEVGSRIAVLLDSSVNVVIAFLAIQKIRMVYVPIDKKYPEDRVRFILNDSMAKVVIVDGIGDYKLAQKGEQINIFDFTENPWSLEAEKIHLEAAKLEDESFIIYSSGTTGKPKGAVHEKRCLANLMKWQIEASGIPSGLNNLQYTSIGFDVSVQEIAFSLLSGGKLHMIPTRIKKNFILLEAYILNHDINSCYFTCSILNAFFNSSNRIQESQLRHIITGGEKLMLQKGIKEYLKSKKEVFVYNFYGPSETHGVTWYPINLGLDNLNIVPPIGFPIYNSSVFILNENAKMVGLDQEGEIYISGKQVARGYNGRAKLTTEKFIDIAYCDERTYKTGDFAKWNHKHDLLFTDRKDFQVKINGNRVELTEINEYALKMKGVIEVSTQYFQSKNIGALVFFYSSTDTLDTELIQAHLRNFLPDYMIPSIMISLEKFPLTSNGKLDVDQLELVFRAIQKEKEKEVELPESLNEKKVFKIWKQILPQHNFGIKNNFFEVGGDSLKIIQLSGLLEKAFEKEFPVVSLFEFNTIEKIVIEFLEIEKTKNIKISTF
jgi:amino acid adenylation domain-containing protein